MINSDPRFWLGPVLQRFGEKADWRRLHEALRSAFAYYEEAHLHATDEEKAREIWRETDLRLLRGLGVKRAEAVADWLVTHWEEPGLWPKTPGTPEVLEELKKRGLRLAVVSNWDVLLPRVLAAMGLLPYFDAVFASAALGVKKPDPAIYAHALKALDLRPEEVLFVGDRPDADVEMPRRLGMRSLQVEPRTGIWPVLDVL